MHVMCDAPQAFYLIVQRQLMDEKEPVLQSDLLPHLFVDQDHESTQKGKYLYRALAANVDLQTNWNEHKAVHFYNQRAKPRRTGSRNYTVTSAAYSCHVAILAPMRRISSCVRQPAICWC